MTAKRPMIADPHGGRMVQEWIGATPDSRPPTAVRLRVLLRYKGRCHWSGLRIDVGDEWDVDHVKPLADGGENRETNLAPILRPKHREKTAAENSARKKADRIRAKHLGVWPKSSRPLRSRGFAKGPRQGWGKSEGADNDQR